MSANCCNGCTEPPCGSPILEFVSVQASCETTCATGDVVWDIARDGLIRTYTTTLVDGDCNTEETCSGDGWSITYANSASTSPVDNGDGTGSDGCVGSDTATLTTTRDSDCDITAVWSGSGSYTKTDYRDGSTTTSSWTVNADGSLNYSTADEFGCAGTTTTTRSPDEELETTVSSTLVKAECSLTFPEYPPWQAQAWEDANPSLLTGQSRTGTATRSWSNFEARVAIDPDLVGPGDFTEDGIESAAGAAKTEKKFKYRIRHLPTANCYLKVWFRKTTIVTADPGADPPVSASTTFDDSETYEWTGTGNPCFPDPTKSRIDYELQSILSDPVEVLPPEEDGEITVSILKWSCVLGYEPDVSDEENPQPNGFPDPTWEAAPP